ncbi:hypothetical protein D9757_003440 [Collybiopsis confluens]|uniref:Uncharacterized protein n=1 Tax=Collybiopsis confluens TaxID=2823264 RepID=A0A8H5HTP1_9AGAR|nr:hypothetical protein D9757_003440 [Collybiopsis confluens]
MPTSHAAPLKGKRSFTGRHTLLPAIQPITDTAQSQARAIGVFAFTFGRGSVIWKIWPAVMFYTCFSTAIVVLEEKGGLRSLAIPNVMLTVLGFVISYRAMSGYDRYWMGRTAWSDVIKSCRTISRLVWYHVPPRLTPKTAEETASGKMNRTPHELMKVMAEKRMALDLVEAITFEARGLIYTYGTNAHFAEGEHGIYFEDLYHLVRPLHEHDHTIEQNNAAISNDLPVPTKARRIASNPGLPRPGIFPHQFANHQSRSTESTPRDMGDPVIPPINAYGTFSQGSSVSHGSNHRSLRRTSSTSSSPNRHTNPSLHRKVRNVEPDLVPFSGVFRKIRDWLIGIFSSSLTISDDNWRDPYGYDASQRKWSGPIHPRAGEPKHHTYLRARGENLPLEILRCLSEWCSLTDYEGTSLGSLIGCIGDLETSLVTLERILTTPLPFVYSVHIRHTVWIYLFFLPFQLIDQFTWYAIPGTAIAAFIYLGFLAAGEEIEQPFGYDDNDLDLDLFCQEIIHVDIENLKRTPCLNAYFPPPAHTRPHQRSMTITEVADIVSPIDFPLPK